MNDSDTELFRLSESEYGGSYRQDFVSLYVSYVDSAAKISERRYDNNKFFLSANTGLLALFGILSGDDSNLLWLAALAGIAFSIAWRALILSYKGLNTAKFEVIHELEKKLPFAAYDKEWEILGRGKDHDVHIPFGQIEQAVPLVFVILHGIVFFMNLFQVINS
jgi:hypothetical protein